MKKIKLSNGQNSLVDDEDFETLSKFKWSTQSKGYVCRVKHVKLGRKSYASKMILMHREILNPDAGLQVDHINGDKLDNRRENLRICSNSQNHMNIKKYKNKSSIFKGVYYDKSRDRWAADIKLNKKKIRLGRHDSEIAAALAYNSAARELFGEFALLNDIRSRA